jgi:DNA-binding NarL/FixJ family response regulator
MVAKKVLLVDSDELTVSFVTRLMRRNGFDVIQAGSGAAARSLPASFEVGVFEVSMGDGDGILLAGEMLADARVRRVVFFTDVVDVDLLKEAARLGPVLSKDAPASALIAAVGASKRPVTHIPPSPGTHRQPDPKSRLG